ncbi:hypothetical protein, conserved [Eimeria praecox]|uniref:Uncharacterized protein n=1 Tax=Eimeria praecox TaxID=51316 RepID=U6H457_9EIME|nr:hypothetical protein, conserved [Eimeria praecox]
MVGKGPLPPAGPPKGPPPGAKIAIKGSGPPPGKVALPKPPSPGSASVVKPGPPPKTSGGPASGVIPTKPPLGAPNGGAAKPALPLAKKELPKQPAPPAGTKATDTPLRAPLPLKSPASPKSLLEKVPGALKQPAPGPPSPLGTTKAVAPKPLITASKGPPGGPPQQASGDGAGNGNAKAAKVTPGADPSAAYKGPPGTSLPQKNGPPGLPPAAKGLPGSPLAAKEPSGLASVAEGALSVGVKKPPGLSPAPAMPATPATTAPSAALASTVSKPIPPSKAKPVNPSKAADETQALSNTGSPGVDEFGRQRGSVGDLAPKSEITHDLLGNVIPVFDKAGKFVAFASGPPAPLSRSDPTRRCAYLLSRRLSDRKPQERDTIKMPSARGVDSGALGSLNVPGGIPGFFLSVPPWPAPTPMPMDQAAGWGAYQQFIGHPVPQISPYAAFPPQAVPQVPYPMMYGPSGGHGKEQQGYAPQQETFEGATWPSYPVQLDAHNAGVAASEGAPLYSSKVAASPVAPPLKETRSRKSRGHLPDDFEGSRTRGSAVRRGDEEVGKSKWMPIERHLNSIRGGYGEACRPPEEEVTPPRKPSSRARRRNSSVRDDVYSGFRPYYIRDKKPFVEEDVPRRTYQSLSELASCFSNLEAEDQDDVINLLLLCRKLEQQVEKQHVVIDMLEHELSEAQKVLKFPPEWRTVEGLDLAGMVPSDTPFQATAATPLYIKSASVLPSNIPDDPSASFGLGVPLSKESKGSSGAPLPAKTTAPPAVGATAPKTAGGTAEGTKKPPAPFKPKPSVMGLKKPVFKKM